MPRRAKWWGHPGRLRLRPLSTNEPAAVVAWAAKQGVGLSATMSPERGLDWLNLFVGNIQTGFGPFIAVYLTTLGWTQTSIGLALSLGPIAALSLTIAGPAMLGLRFGRNARFASIGNGIGAALMGACGYYVSERAVFFLTAALTLPALLPLLPLARLDYRGVPVDGHDNSPTSREAPGRVLRNRALLTFATCAMLFTLGNAAMLPLVGNALTKTVGGEANLVIAACIVLPQLVVAAISPGIGWLAEANGRRLVLLLGFCTLPIRGLLFAVVTDPILVVLIQVLDGIAAACLGVMVPLVTSDVAGRSGHFNLSLGFVGFAMGIGATLSTSLTGWVGDRYGHPIAFISLAAIGLAATMLVWGAMPETRTTRRLPTQKR